MIILGIESSCDETSIAILDDENLKANLIASQHIHKKFGGVIPELSSRAHLQQIIPLIKAALKKADCSLEDIDLVTSTAGPGLVGALLVGFTFGKSLALSLNKPFVSVNHIEGHIFSGFLMEEKPEYPFLAIVVSGGHTLLLLVKNEFEIYKLGSTIDDAIGESFDKVSKMIGLGYPGGPLIQEHAKKGNENEYNFPIGKSKNKYDFSFSGVKTSVLRKIQEIEKERDLTEQIKSDIAASFQKSAVEAITLRLKDALNEFETKSISLVGGVAANELLRKEVKNIGADFNKKVVIPKLEFCSDNAAMIALRGAQYHKAGYKFDLSCNVFPSLPKEQFKVCKK
ncbi:MAG: tRNA (adenosine(37)-N6)-threonylcarbamoyltransferase complex transferase subunit TsaD [Ignavibacteriae bacterium]|nr:MAG: tRNA (adenosine(37)-N6)-threonylcarbamoyltransferase complex transferase subunit TsaD [Ignavibacteriota bacterium]